MIWAAAEYLNTMVATIATIRIVLKYLGCNVMVGIRHLILLKLFSRITLAPSGAAKKKSHIVAHHKQTQQTTTTRDRVSIRSRAAMMLFIIPVHHALHAVL